MISCTLLKGSKASGLAYFSSVSPSMYSIAMKETPPSSPTSKIVTMFGCRSLPAAWASRRKRWLVSRASSSEVPGGRTIVLIATLRSIFGSLARNTWPIAPLPISRMISKRPSLVSFIDRSPRVRVSGPDVGSAEGTSMSRKWPPQRILVSGRRAVKPACFPPRAVYLFFYHRLRPDDPPGWRLSAYILGIPEGGSRVPAPSDRDSCGLRPAPFVRPGGGGRADEGQGALTSSDRAGRSRARAHLRHPGDLTGPG